MPTKLEKRVRTVTESDDLYANRVGIPYSRVSDKSQETNGTGGMSQQTRCIKKLEELGIPLERSFVDTYTGGGDFMNRPAMRALLAYIDANPAKQFVVIFDDLKRFARDTEFHIKLRTELKIRDVIPLCLNYKFDDTPEGMFVETIFAAAAELERNQNPRQVIHNMKARLDGGYWPFAKKRGYDMVLEPGKGKVARPNKIGLEAIKPALEGFASGNLPRKIDVAKFLIERGLWEGKSPVRVLDYVSTILNDSFYCGDVEYKPWEAKRARGNHERLIEPDTFARIQARLSNDSATQKPRKDTSEEFPLRGLLVCAVCNGHLCASLSTGRSKKYQYYFCQTKGCEMFYKSLRKQAVEDHFIELLSRNKLKPEVESVASAVFNKVWSKEAEAYKWQEYLTEQRKTELSKKLKELSEMARKAKSEAVVRTYETQMNEAAVELEKMEATGPVVRDPSIPYRTAFDKSMGMLRSPVSTWDLFDVHDQHRLFFFLFERKLAYTKNEGYRTGNELSKTRLFEELAATNSDDVDTAYKTLNLLKCYLAEFWAFYRSSPALQKTLEKVSS